MFNPTILETQQAKIINKSEKLESRLSQDFESFQTVIANLQDDYKKSQSYQDFQAIQSLKDDYKIENNIKIINPDPSQNFNEGSDETELFFLQHSRGSMTFAGGGNDIIRGSDINQKEFLLGEEGNDTIIGGGGKYDYLYGGAGNDLLTGGNGVDIFKMSVGIDTVTDFNASEGDEISLMNIKENNIGKVYIAEIGEDTHIIPQNLNGTMILEDTNVNEVLPHIMDINKNQLVVLPSGDN